MIDQATILAVRQLRLVRSLLADPARWTKGAMAKDASGENVSPHSPKATCWCLVGAVYKVRDDNPDVRGSCVGDTIDISKAIDRAVSARGFGRNCAAYQDRADTTHADVLSLIDEAIKGLDPAGEYDPLAGMLVDINKDKEDASGNGS